MLVRDSDPWYLVSMPRILAIRATLIAVSRVTTSGYPGGYADGMVRYDMHPNFLCEFSDFAYRYDWQGTGGTARIEWAVPADGLGRFSELTLNRTWVVGQ